MSKKDAVKIDAAIAAFGHKGNFIAAVLYHGDLHGATPVEAHIDTGRGKLSMIFKNGKTQFETDVMDLSPDQSATAVEEHNKFLASHKTTFNSTATRPIEKMGFYPVDHTGAYKEGGVNVPVLVLT